MERAVKDVFCPWCGQTLVRKYNTRLTINGKPTDRVLLFKIIRWNGERGELELSLTPGDYHKYSTLNLNPEEELTFIHAHNGDVNVYADRGCHKRMNEGMFVKILVQFEDSPDIYEYYIVAKNGIEQTLYNIHPQYIIKEDGLFYKKNALQKREFECVPQGRTYKDIGEYLKQQIKSISQRGLSHNQGPSIRSLVFLFPLVFIYQKHTLYVLYLKQYIHALRTAHDNYNYNKPIIW